MDAYLCFWGVACYCVTGWLFFVKEVRSVGATETRLLNSTPQDKEDLDVNEMDVKRVYLTIWDICKLKRECWNRSPSLTLIRNPMF